MRILCLNVDEVIILLVFNCILALSFEELLLSSSLTLHKDMTAVSCIKCRKMLIHSIDSLNSDTVVFVLLLKTPRRDIFASFHITFPLLDSACSYGIYSAEALRIFISLILILWLLFNDQIWKSRWFLFVLTFLLEFTLTINPR